MNLDIFILFAMWITGAFLFMLFAFSLAIQEQKEIDYSVYVLSLFWFPLVLGVILIAGIDLISEYLYEKQGN